MIDVSRNLFAGAMLACACLGVAEAHPAGPDGIVRVRSAYPVDETVARIRAEIAAKGILFFQAVDETQLATAAAVVESITSTIKAQ